MAEQAINTIYALGEHPDRLCDELIKNLAVRAFSSNRTLVNDNPEPDSQTQAQTQAQDETQMEGVTQDSALKQEGEETAAGSFRSTQASSPAVDSFEFAQVLHVVGHVAIKHLVYLEIVERELKRQKDQQPKGVFEQVSRI